MPSSSRLAQPAAFPAALPQQCTHARIHPGLDNAYCPGCQRSFGPRTPEYKAALSRPPGHFALSSGGRVDERTPELFEKHASGWIERYLAKGRWEYHRYCYQEGRKGKPKRLHIPVDAGKLAKVREAIAQRKSPHQIEQLIKSWSKADER